MLKKKTDLSPDEKIHVQVTEKGRMYCELMELAESFLWAMEFVENMLVMANWSIRERERSKLEKAREWVKRLKK